MPVMSGLTPFLLRADKSELSADATITSGTAAFGAWVELYASTTIQHNYITVILHDNNTSNEYEVQLGIGAAGSEVVRIDGIIFHVDLTGMNEVSQVYTYKVEVPINTRVAARVKATANTDTILVEINAQGT